MSKRQCLPNSNQATEVRISQKPAPGFNRRAIPPQAVEAQWTTADGWPIRRIDWPQADGRVRGSLLFMPGRGDAYEKYLESLNHWHDSGWRVTAADWRGQAGSGRLGADDVTGHIDDFATWVGDLAQFWVQWKASTPGPHILIGHSMGGHLVLRALAEAQVDPDAMVLSAPMLGFLNMGMPNALMQWAAKLMCKIGDPRRSAWKWSEKPGQVLASRILLLTHDETRYADELWWRDHRGEIVMGPGSWGWVERAYASMRVLARRGMLEAVTTPVLILATDHDRLVSFPAIQRAARRLVRGQLKRFGEEARHEVLREVDVVREDALHTIADFLDRTAPRAD